MSSYQVAKAIKENGGRITLKKLIKETEKTQGQIAKHINTLYMKGNIKKDHSKAKEVIYELKKMPKKPYTVKQLLKKQNKHKNKKRRPQSE